MSAGPTTFENSIYPVEQNVSDFILNHSSRDIETVLSEQPQHIHDIALTSAVTSHLSGKVAAIYRTGVTEHGLHTALEMGVRMMAREDGTLGMFNAMRTMNALLKVSRSEELSPHAPVVSRLLDRIGLHGPARTVENIHDSLQAKNDVRHLKFNLRDIDEAIRSGLDLSHARRLSNILSDRMPYLKHDGPSRS